jgi:haloalkane dehalogenase
VLVAFSDSDAITKGGERVFLQKMPGTNGQAHRMIEGAGHFLQEDKGEELAEVVGTFVKANPL